MAALKYFLISLSSPNDLSADATVAAIVSKFFWQIHTFGKSY